MTFCANRTTPLRRLLAPLLVVALLVPLLGIGAPAAAAATTTRLAGADRYATAAAVSRSRFAAGVPVVFIVTGRKSPDALAAGPAASRRGGPVLLVDTGSIPQPTRDELTRLQPKSIVVSGGPSAVSDAVVADLRRYTSGTVTRVAGADRYETAARVSAATFPTASAVFVANGHAVADALAGAPAAHAAGAPLLLVATHSIPSSTAQEIRRLGAGRVVLLGGTGVISSGVESQLRSMVSDVSRIAGSDRWTTATSISSRTFAAGTPTAYLASGLSYADALAGGPVAALAPGPILLASTNCIPAAVEWELGRLNPQRIVLLGGTSVLGQGVERRSICPSPGAQSRTPVVSPTPSPAWNDAAPDPDLVRFGDTWYLYSTGTTWGNRIGVLRSTRPDTGWQTITGKPYGSTALPQIPAWQLPDTQWAPGVYEWRGRYVMFYAAKMRTTGKWCISSAVASSPAGPFQDGSAAPIVCQLDLGGSIDPKPFVDAGGKPWLHWKNNDGSTPDVSRIWAAPIGGDGKSIAGPPREVMAKDTSRYPWQHTLDNPQMVLVGGVHYLFHTGGDWQNDSYTVGYAVCHGPVGPCTTHKDPILSSYGDAAGPGGGTVERGQDGRWWMSYHAWDPSCTNDSCGGVRRLYVASLSWR